MHLRTLTLITVLFFLGFYPLFAQELNLNLDLKSQSKSRKKTDLFKLAAPIEEASPFVENIATFTVPADSAGKCLRIDVNVWQGGGNTTRCSGSSGVKCGNNSTNSARDGSVGFRGCPTVAQEGRTYTIKSDAIYNALENQLSTTCTGSCCSPGQTSPRTTAITCLVIRNGYNGDLADPDNQHVLVTCSSGECTLNGDAMVSISNTAVSASETCTDYTDCSGNVE